VVADVLYSKQNQSIYSQIVGRCVLNIYPSKLFIYVRKVAIYQVPSKIIKN